MNKNFLAIIKAGYYLAEFTEAEFTESDEFDYWDDDPAGTVIDWLIAVGIFKDGSSEVQGIVRIGCSLFDFSPERDSKITQILCAFRHAENTSELDDAMSFLMKDAKNFMADLAAAEAAELAANTPEPAPAALRKTRRI